MFAAAFLAGAAAAVGINRTLDVHLAQRQPRVESEPIFVALRSLPQGAPVTVWDVALREWPKAMLPAAAMRPRDSFEGMVLRHPVREGQPVLSVQLVRSVAATGEQLVDMAPTLPPPILPDPVHEAIATPDAPQQTDLWAPAEVPAAAAAAQPAADVPVVAAVSEPQTEATETSETAEPVTTTVEGEPVIAEPLFVAAPSSTDVEPVAAPPRDVTRDTVTQPVPVTRYLVVPERIALEADRSFMPRSDAAATNGAEPGARAPAVAKRPATAPVQQGRVVKPTERTSSSGGRATPRPPRSASGQVAPQQQRTATWSWRNMIPSLSMGMGAVEPAAATADQPAGAPPPRTAFRFR